MFRYHEWKFISYLLKFSDRIHSVKNSYGNFFTIANRLSHTWEKPFYPIRNQLSEWISQFANVFTLFLAPLQSSFTEVCRVSTSLFKFSRKFAVNHRQRSNRFIALDKPLKSTFRKSRVKKTRRKTRWDARLACLANFSTEGRGKKSFEEGKYAVTLFQRQRVLPSKEMSES